MTTVEKVKACKTPRDAILVLADVLDVLAQRLDALEAAESEWDSWGDEDEESRQEAFTQSEVQDEFDARLARQHEEALRRMSNADANDVVIPAPAEEKMEYRRMFERQQLRLEEMLESLGENDPDVDWNETYAKGGPWWLYNANRELFMTYSEDTRRAMVADLEEQSPQLAYTMALDVLKQPAGEPDFENGSGALAVATVDGKPKS